MLHQDDLLVIQKVLDGDASAYSTVVNKYKDMAVTLAYNILLNKEDAEEVAQDAFVKAYRALPSFHGKAKFSTWLYRIVVNTALNTKKGKKYLPFSTGNVLSSEPDAIVTGAISQLVNREHRKYIALAMGELNLKERTCITLYYLNELSVQEIHELTGISSSNIKIILHRARKTLYHVLHNCLKEEITTLI